MRNRSRWAIGRTTFSQGGPSGSAGLRPTLSPSRFALTPFPPCLFRSRNSLRRGAEGTEFGAAAQRPSLGGSMEPQRESQVAAALLEVAEAIRAFPAASVAAKRPTRGYGMPSSTDEMMEALTGRDPAEVRQERREDEEQDRARRAERRANIAIGVAGLAAIGSILGAVLH